VKSLLELLEISFDQELYLENVLFYKIQDFANLIADKNNKIDFKIPEFKIKNEDTNLMK
jgi:hypothetical protein